jgi:hypothetical protein
MVRRRIAASIAAVMAAVAGAVLFFSFVNSRDDSNTESSVSKQSVRDEDEPAERASYVGTARAAPVNVDPNLDWRPFDAELHSVFQELSRLETAQFDHGPRAPRVDPLKELDARLDALESEVHAPATARDP